MTKPWWQDRMIAFDTETTGTDPTEARIVTACLVHVGGGLPTTQRVWLIDPGVPIPAEAAAIHGITTEMAQANGVDPKVAIEEIAGEIAASTGSAGEEPLVAFNASFDLTVLSCELARHGLHPLDVGFVVDPFVLDKAADKYRKGSRKLSAVCEHYKTTIDKAHDAASDAIAAARVVYRLMQKFQQLSTMPLSELHEAQKHWYATQAKDPAAVCNREWPVRTSHAPQERT